MSVLPVRLTTHAIDQARDRHRSFFQQRGSAGMYHEVVAALDAGRRAKTVPRWAASYSGRRGKAKTGTGLYVWNEEQTRVYVLQRGPSHKGPCWVVVTTLPVVVAA